MKYTMCKNKDKISMTDPFMCQVIAHQTSRDYVLSLNLFKTFFKKAVSLSYSSNCFHTLFYLPISRCNMNRYNINFKSKNYLI